MSKIQKQGLHAVHVVYKQGGDDGGAVNLADLPGLPGVSLSLSTCGSALFTV